MNINDKDLRNAGFTDRDVENLHGRLREGGTMDELIAALSRRFRVSVWLTVVLALVMAAALASGNRTHIISGGVSAAVALIIAWVTFPPSLGRKASRLQKSISRQAR
ncbi:hypothetical protein QMS86_21940 [Cronobacter dublinensis]|uniref:hypothetical protein n=1 Tax=Cronobacter dublinensis TaxID=413497 RepID=UPI002AC3BDA6|nr:hypothetical protein [Cronobacter dublinensis]EMA8656986.1 hypothetical protein [Cronobacter dublinensis]